MSPEPGELVGPGEVAAICNVKRTTVHQWVQRGVLPQPWDVVSGTRLWRRVDIEAWLETRKSAPKGARA